MQILLVEDNPADCRLIQEALRRKPGAFDLAIASDGPKALSMLALSRDPASGASRPDLILLDLNLPGMSGWEVLEQIKSDPAFRDIPVLILTSSRSHSDVQRAYRLQASSYICKPTRLSDLFHMVDEIEAYWMGTVMLPSREMRSSA
jgi:two-component system, chemotaxis family, response regulator Rcp1